MTRDDVVVSCLLLTMTCCVLLLERRKFDKQGLADEMADLAGQLRSLLPDGDAEPVIEDPVTT